MLKAIRGPLPLSRSQGYGEGRGLQHTWEEHSGEGVRSPQVVGEYALEGLTAGGLLVPGEGRGGTEAQASPPTIKSTWLRAPHSHPSPAAWIQIPVLPHAGSVPVFSSVKWDNSVYCTGIP